MSFRLYLKIQDEEDDILYNEQILGNNECFSDGEIREMLKEYIENVDEDSFEYEIDLDKFLKVFTQYCFNVVKDFTEDTFKESFQNPKSLFWSLPSWTFTGNYAIVFTAVTAIKSKHKNLKTFLCGG